jgi:hypothetical protein
MMTLVAFAAVDCMAMPVADRFGGAWVAGAALQVGLLLLLRSRGREHRFWMGFEVAGLSIVTTFFACMTLFHPLVFRWPVWLVKNTFNTIDFKKPLMVYEVVMILEIAYGVPMLLLALAGGLLAAFINPPGVGPRRAWTLRGPVTATRSASRRPRGRR